MNALNLSPDEFQSLAARVTSVAGKFLAELPTLRTFPSVSGKDTIERFDVPLSERGLRGNALDALEEVVSMSRPPSPRFYGYVQAIRAQVSQGFIRIELQASPPE